jgi:hypothetical protein
MGELGPTPEPTPESPLELTPDQEALLAKLEASGRVQEENNEVRALESDIMEPLSEMLKLLEDIKEKGSSGKLKVEELDDLYNQLKGYSDLIKPLIFEGDGTDKKTPLQQLGHDVNNNNQILIMLEMFKDSIDDWNLEVGSFMTSLEASLKKYNEALEK